jgi:hypothetical protein
MFVVTMNSHEQGLSPAVWGPFRTEELARAWARANEDKLARSSWDDADSIAIVEVKGVGSEKIVDAVVIPPDFFGGEARVFAQFSGDKDGVLQELFRCLAGEIGLSGDELIGLTREEAIELRDKKDLAYLQR